MARTPTLAEWPPEVFESMATYLALADLQNLRLVSKALAVLVVQDTFKHYYRTKHIDMSPESLAEFMHMTESGLLGSIELENLALTGLGIDIEHLANIVEEKARWETEGNGPLFSSTQHKLNDAELEKAKKELDQLKQRKAELEEFRRSGKDIELLAKAFSNIAAYSKNGKLSSLKLEVGLLKEDLVKKLLPIQTRSRSMVWEVAEASFRAAVGALAASGMPLEKLDAMTDQWHCSIGCSTLDCIQQTGEPVLKKALASLHSLSLSLSTDRKPNEEAEAMMDDVDPETEKVRAEGLAKFLAFCPELTHLHLHWFLLRSANADNYLADSLMEEVVKLRAMRSVNSLTLRGLRFKRPILLDVLKNAPIKDLRLENIRIADPDPLPEDQDDESDPEDPSPPNRPEPAAVTSRHWNAIFNHCTGAGANISSIVLEDLWGSRLLLFHNVPGGRPRIPRTPHQSGCERLERKGEDEMRKEIEYGYSRGRALGSPQAYRWNQMRQRDYGPA